MKISDRLEKKLLGEAFRGSSKYKDDSDEPTSFTASKEDNKETSTKRKTLTREQMISILVKEYEKNLKHVPDTKLIDLVDNISGDN